MFNLVGDKLQEIFDGLMMFLFESLISPFMDLRLVHTLIFGRDDTYSTVWGTFRPDELSAALGPLYYTMMGLAGVLLVSLIAVNGARISSAGSNVTSRTSMVDFLKDLAFVGIILLNLDLLYDLIFAINMSVVGLFSSAYDSQQLSLFSTSINAMTDHQAATDSTQNMGVMGTIFVFLILIGLTLWANVYYLMRKVTLIILMALGPLMIVMWLLPQFKSMTGAWFREFTSSVFIQAIHAFVFWTVATVALAEKSFVGTVLLYMLFIPISESIRRLLNVGGDMQGGLNKTAAMFGMASLAGMYGSIKGAVGENKSVMGSLNEAYRGASGAIKGKGGIGEGGSNGVGADDLKKTLGANPGSDTGSDTKAEKMLKTGEIFSKGGKAVLGMAGSIAGSPLGPVGAMAGATGGFALGGAVGGVAGRTGAALAQGIGSRIEKGKNAAAAIGGKEMDKDKLAANIADSETASWAKENKDAVMADLKERFPDATPADLDKKFNNMQKEKRAGFYQNAQANFKSASMAAKGDALGKDLANASSEGMANKWAEENQKPFFDQYDKENPQKPGESTGNYQARRMNAFNDKKNEMRSKFHEMAKGVLPEGGMDAPVSKEDFVRKLGQKMGVDPKGNSDAYKNAMTGAVAGVAGIAGLKQPLGKDVANASADALTNKWVTDNKSAFMKNFEKENPQAEGESAEAYENRKATAFNNKKADARKSFYGAALKSLGGEENLEKPVIGDSFSKNLGSELDSMQNSKDGKAALVGAGQVAGYKSALTGAVAGVAGTKQILGKDAANASADALSEKWGSDNRSSFMKNYESQNPQGSEESNEAYASRKESAFSAKKSQVRQNFYGAAVKSLGGEGKLEEAVQAGTFSNNFNNQLQSMPEVKGSNEMVSAAGNAVNNLGGIKMVSEKGKPNIPYISSGMANAAVQQQRTAFIAGQVSQGVSEVAAGQDWDKNKAVPAYQEKLKTYNDALQNAGNTGSLVNAGGSSQIVGQKLQQTAAFVGAATGVAGFAKGVTMLSEGASNGKAAMATTFADRAYGSNEGSQVGRMTKAVMPAISAGVAATVQPLADDKGGVVNAQADYQNKSGYIGGVIAGAGGYRAGKSFANKVSPFTNKVQESISSPGEVMQMAQTTTDDRGNQQIARGAVRQVITADESYIEVKTNSGENRVVSRKGAGHPGLRKGEAVYQDLQMQDDQLVVAKSPGMQSSSYRLDSGGGRVASNVAVDQNPNTLLGSPRAGSIHQPTPRKNSPIFNQNVDSGKFYVEDLAQAKMENVQVVVEKDRQFVTAQKDGMTYRVSPVYAGDSRLSSGETKTIPMVVKSGSLQPTRSDVSQVAMKAVDAATGTNEDYYSSKSYGGMVPTDAFEDLMPGKQRDRIRRSQLRREELDSVRRKQGILG